MVATGMDGRSPYGSGYTGLRETMAFFESITIFDV